MVIVRCHSVDILTKSSNQDTKQDNYFLLLCCRTINAMLNADSGGTIYLGVSDDSKVHGVVLNLYKVPVLSLLLPMPAVAGVWVESVWQGDHVHVSMCLSVCLCMFCLCSKGKKFELRPFAMHIAVKGCLYVLNPHYPLLLTKP